METKINAEFRRAFMVLAAEISRHLKLLCPNEEWTYTLLNYMVTFKRQGHKGTVELTLINNQEFHLQGTKDYDERVLTINSTSSRTVAIHIVALMEGSET